MTTQTGPMASHRALHIITGPSRSGGGFAADLEGSSLVAVPAGAYQASERATSSPFWYAWDFASVTYQVRSDGEGQAFGGPGGKVQLPAMTGFNLYFPRDGVVRFELTSSDGEHAITDKQGLIHPAGYAYHTSVPGEGAPYFFFLHTSIRTPSGTRHRYFVFSADSAATGYQVAPNNQHRFTFTYNGVHPSYNSGVAVGDSSRRIHFERDSDGYLAFRFDDVGSLWRVEDVWIAYTLDARLNVAPSPFTAEENLPLSYWFGSGGVRRRRLEPSGEEQWEGYGGRLVGDDAGYGWVESQLRRFDGLLGGVPGRSILKGAAAAAWYANTAVEFMWTGGDGYDAENPYMELGLGDVLSLGAFGVGELLDMAENADFIGLPDNHYADTFYALHRSLPSDRELAETIALIAVMKGVGRVSPVGGGTLAQGGAKAVVGTAKAAAEARDELGEKVARELNKVDKRALISAYLDSANRDLQKFQALTAQAKDDWERSLLRFGGASAIPLIRRRRYNMKLMEVVNGSESGLQPETKGD